MPRNMSFWLTQDAFKERRKLVTRRNGWLFLNPGDVLWGVQKAQGLKKGQTITRFNRIRIAECRKEPLQRLIDEPVYGRAEMILEGFPGVAPYAFVAMYCEHNKCSPSTEVNRLRFDYVDEDGNVLPVSVDYAHSIFEAMGAFWGQPGWQITPESIGRSPRNLTELSNE